MNWWRDNGNRLIPRVIVPAVRRIRSESWRGRGRFSSSSSSSSSSVVCEVVSWEWSNQRAQL